MSLYIVFHAAYRSKKTGIIGVIKEGVLNEAGFVIRRIFRAGGYDYKFSDLLSSY